MDSVYIEATVPSYLTAQASRNVVAVARQSITRDWWQHRRNLFRLFTSQLVVLEVSAGDSSASQLRLQALEDIPVLPSSEAVEWIAEQLNRLGLIPPNAEADAFHIGYASVYRINYLLTWNCRHLANAERLPAIEHFLADNGFHVPVVCTPEELMGEEDDDRID